MHLMDSTRRKKVLKAQMGEAGSQFGLSPCSVPVMSCSGCGTELRFGAKHPDWSCARDGVVSAHRLVTCLSRLLPPYRAAWDRSQTGHRPAASLLSGQHNTGLEYFLVLASRGLCHGSFKSSLGNMLSLEWKGILQQLFFSIPSLGG